jgi:hypothetical protein
MSIVTAVLAAWEQFRSSGPAGRQIGVARQLHHQPDSQDTTASFERWQRRTPSLTEQLQQGRNAARGDTESVMDWRRPNMR